MNKNNDFDNISEKLKVLDENVNNSKKLIYNKNKDNIINKSETEILNKEENLSFIDPNILKNSSSSDVDKKIDSEVILNDKVDNIHTNINFNDSNLDNIFNNNNNNNNNLGNSFNNNNNNISLNNSNLHRNKNVGTGVYFSYEKRLILLIAACLLFIILFIVVFKSSISFKENNKAFFSENSNSSFSVCLNENDYYEEECLGENKQYVSRLVKEIPYVFTYNSLYEHKINKEYKYHVDAHLKIFSQDNETNVLYEKNYVLLDETIFNDNNSVFTISDSVNIPFMEYNDLVEKYSNDYGILSNSELTVEFFVNDKAVSTLNIPLNKQTMSISKKDTENSLSIDEMLQKAINKKSTLYNVFLLLIGICLVGSFALLFKFLLKYGKKNDDLTKYKNELNNKIKNYDRIIVEVKDISNLLEGKTIIKVENFLELVDVRDTLDKPILHVKINSIKDGFYVDEGNKVYEFIMKCK